MCQPSMLEMHFCARQRPHTHQSQADKTQGRLTLVSLLDLRLSTREEGRLLYRPAPSELKGLMLDEETSKSKDWSSSGKLDYLAVCGCAVTCHRKGAPVENKRGNERKKLHQSPQWSEPSRLLLWAWTTQANMPCPDRKASRCGGCVAE